MRVTAYQSNLLMIFKNRKGPDATPEATRSTPAHSIDESCGSRRPETTEKLAHSTSPFSLAETPAS